MDPAAQQAQAQQATRMVLAMMPVFFLVGIVVIAFLVFLFWRIFAKSGMPGALGLLVLIPGIGWLIALCILAFGEWKVVPVVQAGYPPPYPPSYPPAGTPPTPSGWNNTTQS